MNSNGVIEHFKKKKKKGGGGGKKKKKGGGGGGGEGQPEINYEEIINRVEEAQELKNEPPDELPDPEDNEDPGYQSPTMEQELFGYGDENIPEDNFDAASFAGTSSFSHANLSPEQKAALAALPDYWMTDILTFAVGDKFPGKKVVCVVPERPKHLYIIEFTGYENQKAVVVGIDTLDVIPQELLPELVEYEVYDPTDGVSFYEAINESQYVIFYDYPDGHPFFAWLNSIGDRDFRFVNYLDSVKERDAKAQIITKYPYLYFKTVDVMAQLVPGRTLSPRWVHTMMVDTVIYSHKPFLYYFYNLYDRYHGRVEHQTFYELFFPFYEEIVRDRIGINQSIKLKELFVDGPGKNNKRAQIVVESRIAEEDLVVNGTVVRDVFKELMWTRPKDQVGIIWDMLRKGDRVLLKNQAHRTLEGEFYVADKRMGTVLLQSRWFLKDVRDLRVVEGGKVLAARVDDAVFRLIQPGDSVYIREVDRGGVFVGKRSGGDFAFSMVDDLLDKDRLYRCVDDAKVLSKGRCLEEGHIWDRPCLFDEECPFFGKGKFSKYRGGCGDGGYCEMPLGYESLSQRFYTRRPTVKGVGDDVRFSGDIYEAENITL